LLITPPSFARTRGTRAARKEHGNDDARRHLALPQMRQLSESDSLASKGCTMGEHMLTQLLTKDQIDAHLEKLDQKIKELETNDIFDTIDELKRIQDPPGFQTNELATSDILDIVDEPKIIQDLPRVQSNEMKNGHISGIIDEPKIIQDPSRIQTNELETSHISDVIDDPKRTQDPPRIYEKTHSENSRLYQAGEFIVSAIAIILIIFAVIFTALISATLWEIIQQFGFRQYVSVAILAAILFGSGYFLGCARRE
jgi:hypothetical protein